MSQAKITVYGRVQGVGFRYHTRQKALELQLTGYVTNQPDRTVEIVADGPDDQVQQLIAWAKVGPATAHVEKIEVEDCPTTQRFDDFVVQY